MVVPTLLQGCPASSVLLQANGFCVSCNAKSNLHERLSLQNTRQASALRVSLQSPLAARRPSLSGGGARARRPSGAALTAFGGRLELKAPPRSPAARADPGLAGVSGSVLDYHFLRLKFLLNKVT